jgi:hypothetical protein
VKQPTYFLIHQNKIFSVWALSHCYITFLLHYYWRVSHRTEFLQFWSLVVSNMLLGVLLNLNKCYSLQLSKMCIILTSQSPSVEPFHAFVSSHLVYTVITILNCHPFINSLIFTLLPNTRLHNFSSVYSVNGAAILNIVQYYQHSDDNENQISAYE